MAIINNITFLKKQRNNLEQDIKKYEQTKNELEKEINLLQRSYWDDLEKEKQIKQNNKQLESTKNQLYIDIEQLTQEKNKIVESLKNREEFYIETELKYIDNLSGKDFEYYCSGLLEKLGYTSIVTKASNDEGCDLKATKDDISYAIQCKRYKDKVGVSAIQEIYAGKDCYECQKAIAFTNNFFTDPAKKMAEKLNVELWNRNKLIEILYQAYNFNLEHIDFIYNDPNIEANSTNEDLDDDLEDDTDPFLMEVIENIIDIGEVSASYIQRKFKVGYIKAGITIDQMEARGIISGYEGNKPRKVLISREDWNLKKYNL